MNGYLWNWLVNNDAHTKWDSMRAAIHCGASAWLVYAAMEICCLSIVSWFIHPNHA